MQSEIVWTRWAVYFVVGLPFLAWLFFTRNRPLKVTAVMAMLIIVQQSFATRRYVWAIGIGPSNITAYVALVSLVMSRRSLPRLGATGPLWGVLLVAAFGGMIVGASADGVLTWNFIALQQYYLESLLFFVIGAAAFDRDEDVRTFLFYVTMLGLVVAVTHTFTLVTGFRFRDFAQAGEEVRRWSYGGFFNNPNTQGSFLCMVIPMALLLVVGRRLSGFRRGLAIVAIVMMTGSLLQSVHRGGIATTFLLGMVVVAVSARRPGTAIGIAMIGALTVVVSYLLAATFLPEFVEKAFDIARWKGLDSPRLQAWPIYLRMAVENPLGIGLTAENIELMSHRYGVPLASAHNLYLQLPLNVGLLGLMAFLGILYSLLSKNHRAWRLATDPARKQLLLCVLLPLLGFAVVGLTESVWDNGFKINQLFWLFAGVSLSTSARFFAERRAGLLATPAPSELGTAPAFGR